MPTLTETLTIAQLRAAFDRMSLERSVLLEHLPQDIAAALLQHGTTPPADPPASDRQPAGARKVEQTYQGAKRFQQQRDAAPDPLRKEGAK